VVARKSPTLSALAPQAPSDADQASWRRELEKLDFNVSPVMDRSYFYSIYIREPGGVLFEIATDQPRFAVDDPADALGTTLKLPPQYELYRKQLEQSLPSLRLPRWSAPAR
jgi:glyoxalase family protein